MFLIDIQIVYATIRNTHLFTINGNVLQSSYAAVMIDDLVTISSFIY